jgi:hypothetical protein
LQGKGLVWNPGDPHHQDNYPFCFYDFAWDAIRARKDEFAAKDKEFKEANKGKR